jgi:hypothetical protein
MTDFLDVMEALAARFVDVDGLAKRHAFPPGDLGTVPAIVVSLGEGEGGIADYDVAMGDVTDLDLIVNVFVQWGDNRAAWSRLTPFLAPTGASSLVAAVNADPTLGGLVDSTRLGQPRNPGPYTYGATRYLGAEFPVEVLL